MKTNEGNRDVKQGYIIKKGDGKYIGDKYVVEYGDSQYLFSSETAAVGLCIDIMGDLHRNKLMVDVIRGGDLRRRDKHIVEDFLEETLIEDVFYVCTLLGLAIGWAIIYWTFFTSL